MKTRYLRTVGHVLLFFALLATTLLLSLGSCFDRRRKQWAENTLAGFCADNTTFLAEFYSEFRKDKGRAPNDIVEILTLATNVPWVSSCGLAYFSDAEVLAAAQSKGLCSCEQQACRDNTYLYLASPICHIRIICSVWHEGLTAVDDSGNVLEVDREMWSNLKIALEASRTNDIAGQTTDTLQRIGE